MVFVGSLVDCRQIDLQRLEGPGKAGIRRIGRWEGAIASNPAAMTFSISSWNLSASGVFHWVGTTPESNVFMVMESWTICFARSEAGY